jgi:hypothetical protein
MSIAESVIPMQEYQTSAARAEIQLGLLTATPRIGVKPDRVDFEMMQDGEAAIFILDSKFNPATDIYQIPPPSGNLNFLEASMARIQQDTMAMVGMTTPQDTFNPEIMSAGNSGAKLQMAMGPNQIIQDNTVRNAAEGLKEALWLVWRTLIQYGDDYGVKKLAAGCHPEKTPEFLDFKSWDEMDFCDRHQIHLELAIGMLSDENQLNRIKMIQAAQTGLYQTVQAMVQQNTLTPEMFVKIKKPYEDSLYVLGVKDCNVYLPTDEEVKAMIQQAQQAAAQKQPDPTTQAEVAATTAKAQLDQVKAAQIQAEMHGDTAKAQLDYMAQAQGHPKVYN